MKKTSKILFVVMAFLILGNTPGLAMVCAPGCKASAQGLELCLKACASDKFETQKKYPGLPLLSSKGACTSLRLAQSLPVLSAAKFDVSLPSIAFAVPGPMVSSLLVDPSLHALLSIHAPPRVLLSQAVLLSTSPQNAPPVLG